MIKRYSVIQRVCLYCITLFSCIPNESIKFDFRRWIGYALCIRRPVGSEPRKGASASCTLNKKSEEGGSKSRALSVTCWKGLTVQPDFVLIYTALASIVYIGIGFMFLLMGLFNADFKRDVGHLRTIMILWTSGLMCLPLVGRVFNWW